MPPGQSGSAVSPWRRLEGGEHAPRAFVLDAEPVTTVVAGSASWRELRALAAALPTR